MGFIEGVGDEVVVFAVILLVLILAATITFLLNSSPFTSHQISQTRAEPAPSQDHEQTVRENPNEDNRNTDTVDSNHTTPDTNNAEEERTHEVEIVEAADSNEVSSENTADSHLYPNLDTCATPSAPEAETTENNVEAEEARPSDPDEIHIRLKYLDDTERTVTSNPRVKIGDFKRTHFVEEFASNKIVRLIFSGQLLRDNVTLQSYNVTNNCVVHVQVLQAQTQQNPSSLSQNTELDLSHLLWPLLSVILGICWILYLKYPEFFNFVSLGMLLLFTGSFFYFYFQIQQHQ